MRGKGSTKSQNIERFKEIIALAKREPSMSRPELAKTLQVSRNTVDKALGKYTDFNEEIWLFRKQKPEILDSKLALILKAIDTKKVSEAKLRDLAVSAGIIFDKSRLESGLSTQNINSWCSIVQAANRKIEKEINPKSANPVQMDDENDL